MPRSLTREIWPRINADKRGSKRNRSSAFIRVHPRLKLVFLSALFVGVAAGQAVPVVTVCEALQGRDAYNGKSIVVVGWLSFNVEGSWLSEDCERKIVTDGYIWPNMIAVGYSRSEGGPAPDLPKNFQWNEDLLSKKLKDVQTTTKIQVLNSNLLSRWVAIFGRFETLPLRAVRGGSAPGRLVYSGKTIHELKAK